MATEGKDGEDPLAPLPMPQHRYTNTCPCNPGHVYKTSVGRNPHHLKSKRHMDYVTALPTENARRAAAREEQMRVGRRCACAPLADLMEDGAAWSAAHKASPIHTVYKECQQRAADHLRAVEESKTRRLRELRNMADDLDTFIEWVYALEQEKEAAEDRFYEVY